MLASSTNKTDRHNLTEILLNVALNINLNQTNQSIVISTLLFVTNSILKLMSIKLLAFHTDFFFSKCVFFIEIPSEGMIMDPGKNNIKCVLVPTGAGCIRKKPKKTQKLLYYIIVWFFFSFFGRT